MEQVHSGICELGQLARPQLLFHAVYHQLKVEYLIICIICDTDLVNKLILQVYTLHKYK